MLTRRRAFPLFLATLLAGCADDVGPTSPGLENSIFTLLGSLEVGQAIMVSGAAADSVFVAGGVNGAEYLYVPFLASEAGTARLQVEVQGSNLQSVAAGSPFAQRGSEVFDQSSLAGHLHHEQFLERTHRELEPKLVRLSAEVRSRGLNLSRLPSTAEVPQVGATLRLNTSVSCAVPDYRAGRVEAVSRTAIVVADTANPSNGFTAAHYQEFARQFDELIYPVLTRAFGEPTDIDQNARSILFVTRAVNELTPPGSSGYVAGYFWAGDLFPREFCPASNEAEIFYLIAPDPLGEINRNRRPTESLRTRTPGLLGHEFQHLINAGRRIYINDAETFEQAWLNEGLSHIAEELLFYEESGLGPRQNITLSTLVSNQRVLQAVNTYQVNNLALFGTYLEQPQEESLLGIDNLETRGATWAFLRYAADHDPRPDEQLFRQLVNSPYAGTENLARALGSDPIDLMQSWTVSVFTDDHVATANPLFQQPSWHFRSVVAGLYRNQRFPLSVLSLRPEGSVQLRLRGGGAAFVQARGTAGQPSLISTTSGGRTPPDRLRVSIIRTR